MEGLIRLDVKGIASVDYEDIKLISWLKDTFLQGKPKLANGLSCLGKILTYLNVDFDPIKSFTPIHDAYLSEIDKNGLTMSETFLNDVRKFIADIVLAQLREMKNLVDMGKINCGNKYF
jgi:hypothetical protein